MVKLGRVKYQIKDYELTIMSYLIHPTSKSVKMITHILTFISHLTLILSCSVSSLTTVILMLQQSDLKHPRR